MEEKILEKATESKGMRKRDKIKAHLSKKQFWQVTTVVFAIMFIWAAYTVYYSVGENYPDAVTVEANTLKFLESEVKKGAPEATIDLKNFSDEGCLYRIDFDIKLGEQVQPYASYITKSGNLFFPTGLEIETSAILDGNKNEKPVVELFVMSHCPYGTQIEKGIIPVVETLKDKIDFEIKFVYYSMHGKKELDEQLLQHCVQKDYNDKYVDYLSCFLEDANASRCVEQVGLTMKELNSCIAETDEQYQVTELFNDESTWLSGRYPLFNVNKEDNDKYGVGGSPTLVINGKEASSSRDSASLLKTICDSFTEAPEECATVLSSETPSTGFGYNIGSNDGGSCE